VRYQINSADCFLSLNETRGLFSKEAIEHYAILIGRAVNIEEMQPVVGELLSTNLIMRVGHGRYTVADPLVGEGRLARQIL